MIDLDATMTASRDITIGYEPFPRSPFTGVFGKAAFVTRGIGNYSGKLQAKLHPDDDYSDVLTFNQDKNAEIQFFDTVSGMTARVTRVSGEFSVRFSS